MDKETRQSLNGLKAEYHLGKAGITDTFLDSVDKYLIAHEFVKVKVTIAQTKSEVKGFADLVSQKLHAKVLEVKGFTFILYKESGE